MLPDKIGEHLTEDDWVELSAGFSDAAGTVPQVYILVLKTHSVCVYVRLCVCVCVRF